MITIHEDEYLGAVKYESTWRFFFAELSMWILDYASYTGFEPSSENPWRAGLLCVDESNAEAYCDFMANRELSADQLPDVAKQPYAIRHWPSGPQFFTFVVNFDETLFVNGWHENIPIGDYVPVGWTAKEDDPDKYVPSEFVSFMDK